MSLPDALDAVLGLSEKATGGEWEWWTSNSTKRLSVKHGRDGGVLCPYRASDGLADLAVSEDDMALIAAAVNFLREHGPELRRLADAGVAGDAKRYRWLTEYPNLYACAELLRGDHYVTLTRCVDSLMEFDTAIAAHGGEGGRA
jgi:hypothetical protein